MDIDIILVPYDSGLRGVRMGAGPETLVASGLCGRLEQRGNVVRTRTVEAAAGEWHAELATGFQLAAEVARRVRSAREARRFPLVLAGNCGISLGVCAALGGNTTVAWADAHGDFNTPETTIGGFLDGMALATLTGRCWSEIARTVPGFVPIDESRVWLLGARDLDPLEAEALDASSVHRVSAENLRDETAREIARETGEAPVYLHIDLDVLDATAARANSFAVAGGVSVDALAQFCGALKATAPPAAMTISAYDPAADVDGRAREAAFAVLEALL